MKTEWIPRPIRACLWALLVILVAVAYYIALSCPTVSMKQEFRRAEKTHLVGPSKIVDRVAEYYDFEMLFVGETDHGICFFGRSGSRISGGKHGGEKHYVFSYREKTGDLTVVAAPNYWGQSWFMQGVNLPAYVFTEHPDAVSAEIEITVTGERTLNVNGDVTVTPYQANFKANATRSQNGYFRFFLDCTDENSGYALCTLSDFTSGCDLIWSHYRTVSIPVTVKLYDANDQLILTREMNLGTPTQQS